jgi:hypothetical protein
MIFKKKKKKLPDKSGRLKKKIEKKIVGVYTVII